MTQVKKTIREILCQGVLHEREPQSVELTKEIFQQIKELEYEDVSSDKENLRNDIQNIENDLRTGVRECKEKYRLEFA